MKTMFTTVAALSLLLLSPTVAQGSKCDERGNWRQDGGKNASQSRFEVQARNKSYATKPPQWVMTRTRTLVWDEVLQRPVWQVEAANETLGQRYSKMLAGDPAPTGQDGAELEIEFKEGPRPEDGAEDNRKSMVCYVSFLEKGKRIEGNQQTKINPVLCVNGTIGNKTMVPANVECDRSFNAGKGRYIIQLTLRKPR